MLHRCKLFLVCYVHAFLFHKTLPWCWLAFLGCIVTMVVTIFSGVNIFPHFSKYLIKATWFCALQDLWTIFLLLDDHRTSIWDHFQIRILPQGGTVHSYLLRWINMWLRQMKMWTKRVSYVFPLFTILLEMPHTLVIARLRII